MQTNIPLPGRAGLACYSKEQWKQMVTALQTSLAPLACVQIC